MSSRYLIGIDLGTTNSALAYIDTLVSGGSPEILQVEQLDNLDSAIRTPTLPSLACYLAETERCAIPADLLSTLVIDDKFACGRYAHGQLSSAPSRVVHSAKSWLAHERIDRHDAILPWDSDEIPASERLSPLQASALYLRFLRENWDRTMGSGKKEYLFANQEITITVPASFDEAAQRLTLEAAALAGFPSSVRLLEEPQAAFYTFLSSRGNSPEFADVKDGARVLVCDIGGGTTDFSLLEIDRASAEVPARRLAVSDHLLLGGDNIDLALALMLKEKFRAPLSRRQERYLLFQARQIKERLLGASGPSEEELTVSVPGEGSRLFEGVLSARIGTREVLEALDKGFFPDCPREAVPDRLELGLREFGLPYVSDSAVTRHLAAFLKGQEIDAVLYNGGTLEAPRFRSLLTGQIERWQGRRPVELENFDRALAVARGGALYLRHLREGTGRIRSGYPRTVYLEAATPEGESILVCLVPKGMDVGEKVIIEEPPFEVIVGEAVRFQPHTSLEGGDAPGTLRPLERDTLHTLPSLETVLNVRPGLPRGALRVSLEASITELGMLDLYCVHKPRVGIEARWKLEFNLRSRKESKPHEETQEDSASLDQKIVLFASEKILFYYGKGKSGIQTDPPRRLMRELEGIFGKARGEWDVPLLRSLWPALLPGLTRRNRSVVHETSWFYLAGYVLRPGYGAPLDSVKVGELWKAFDMGRFFKKDANSRVQWWIMWRRVAGGLDRIQQELLYEKESEGLKFKGGEEVELLRLVASLERINLDWKAELGERLVKQLTSPATVLTEHEAWAFGRLASRVPLYGGPHNVIPPEIVGKWCRTILESRSSATLGRPVLNALAQVARQCGEKLCDLDEADREMIIAFLEKKGLDEERMRCVREFVPVDTALASQLFGEELPLGLRVVEE